MSGAPRATPSDTFFFEIERSAAIVNARMSSAADPRLKEVMGILVRHLHAAVIEARVTLPEWSTAIGFLTEVGQTCTDWRQEFILLSDILGVSMLVDAIDGDHSDAATESTVLGPFHVADAPMLPDDADLCLDGKGEPLAMLGQVVDAAGEPIAGALVDIWQANEDGFYDVQRRDDIPEWNLRGRLRAGSDGRFRFRTVKPRFYPIPSDGPVGRLLSALGRHPLRPAHLHFIVSAPGFRPVTTHLFDPECPYLHEDAVFGVKRSLIGAFDRPAGASGEAGSWQVRHQFVLDRSE